MMKRFIIPAIALLFVAGGVTTSLAQKITSISHGDSCGNVVGKYATYTFINTTGTTPGCTMETNWGDGSKKDTTALSGTFMFATHTFPAAGNYTVKNVLICGGVRADSLNTNYKIQCNYIGGFLYADANSNCVYDAGESRLPSKVRIQVDSAGVVVDTVVSNGYWGYTMTASTTTIYQFRLLNAPTGFVLSCPASGIVTDTFNPSVGSLAVVNFGFRCSSTPVSDYQLNWSRVLRSTTSGGSSRITLFASNSTCDSGTGTVTLNVSPKYTISTGSVSPAPTSISGNTITWNIGNMSKGKVTVLNVPVIPKTTTFNGDTACNSAFISSGAADVNPGNNVISKCDTVSGSWDPNHKSVVPEGIITAGTTLTYTIEFENLGNDTAFNVYIQDTLSGALDPTTLEVLSTTHLLGYAVYSYGTSTIVKFDFPDIRLAGMNYPLSNKGSVTYSIRVKPNTGNGHLIYNSAGIYFDGNPVVMTNTTLNKTPGTADVGRVKGNAAIKVFPNPANNVLTVQVAGEGWEEAIVSNAVGQVMMQQELKRGDNLLQIGRLPSGVYYVQTRGSAGSLLNKIEKR